MSKSYNLVDAQRRTFETGSYSIGSGKNKDDTYW